MLGLDIAYLCTNLDNSSFSRSRDMVCAHQNLMAHVTGPHPFLGWFAIHRLALATVNVPTKFEVSISTHYVDMKGNIKCRKWGGLK